MPTHDRSLNEHEEEQIYEGFFGDALWSYHNRNKGGYWSSVDINEVL